MRDKSTSVGVILLPMRNARSRRLEGEQQERMAGWRKRLGVVLRWSGVVFYHLFFHGPVFLCRLGHSHVIPPRHVVVGTGVPRGFVGPRLVSALVLLC